MRWGAGVLAASAVLLGLVPVPSAVAGPEWGQVSAGSTGGLSGVAPAASGWVVVRDNKAAGQNRIALLDMNGTAVPLSWPGTAPQDLESVAAVPGQVGTFAALTSSGSGTLLSISGMTASRVGAFTVPRGSSNIESFALTRTGTSTVAVWATRGSPTAAAKMFAATFDPGSRTFGRVVTGSVRVPYPTTSVRHVADLAVAGSRLLGVATSDPGANGPFVSATYDLGSVGVASGRANLALQQPRVLATYPGHKVEGLACSGGTGILVSDDEKQGGWTRTDSFC